MLVFAYWVLRDPDRRWSAQICVQADHLVIKGSTTGADSEGMHRFAFSQGSTRDRPSKMRRRRSAVIALTALVVAARVALLISDTAGSSGLLHPLPYTSCGAPAFEPPESREGLCALDEGSNIVVKNIVDRNSTLHMPEYDARLITWTIARTHVTNWRNEPALYPEGRGVLVSLEVEISNPGSKPLQYGPPIARASAPSYRPHLPAELALPISAGPGEDASFAALFNARGAPSPSLFGQPPVQPGLSITGWISVVAPASASGLMGMERSDLELRPVDGNPNYVGIIRLWKNSAAHAVPL